MYLCNNINDINIDEIFCYDKIKNNIMDNSNFYKLIYSDKYTTFNGIFFYFDLKNCLIEKYFDKLKITISDKMENKNIIEKINELEEKIFLKFKTKFSNLNIEKRLSKQFSQNYIKIANCKHKNLNTMNSLKILVKISGIWESLNTKQVGLTFKFFLLNKNY